MGPNKTEVFVQWDIVIEEVPEKEYFCKCVMDSLNM